MGGEELKGGVGTLVFNTVPQKSRHSAAVSWAEKNHCTGRGKAPCLFLFSSLVASAELLGHPKRSEMSSFATAKAHPQKSDVGKEASFSQR